MYSPTKKHGVNLLGIPVFEKIFRRARRSSDVSSAPPPISRNLMGQFVSSRKKTHSESERERDSRQTNTSSAISRNSPSSTLARYAELLTEQGYLPEFLLIHEHLSSMYVDEDGDIAHEFYAEGQDGTRRRLCRIINNLRPKGTERLPIPRLSPDLPIVMWEVK
ncbi:unnamed protein product, partial [Mesorhabditis belari]|uniref:Uncharacterized protein n=1 Tax=Mesorhabditis belari TaxID=2138241 RepID=A0AAF3FC49_9BILA